MFARKIVVVTAVFERQLLQFAIGASHARKTVFVVIAEHKFERGFARSYYFGRIGKHFHSFRNRRNARNDETSRSFHLHYAHTAAAFVGEIFQVTKRGNIVSRLSCGVENTRTFRHGNRSIVYFQCNVFHHNTSIIS